jgi:hypothetical protein
VIAEVAHRDAWYFVVLDDASGRVRQHDLTTMRSRAYPCRATDSNADVAIGMEMRFGGVQTHPHPHHVSSRKRALRGNGRRDRIDRTLENDEESVALGIDFASTMCPEGFTEKTTMLRAEVAVRGAVPARKLRRTLNVAKEESHRTGRQPTTHQPGAREQNSLQTGMCVSVSKAAIRHFRIEGSNPSPSAQPSRASQTTRRYWWCGGFGDRIVQSGRVHRRRRKSSIWCSLAGDWRTGRRFTGADASADGARRAAAA